MTARPAWLTVAEKQVGYKEQPGNRTKYGKALGLDGEPWCDMFVAWCCEKSGHPLPSMQPGMRTGAAAVYYSIEFAKAHGLWHPSWKAEPGWQIAYGWNGPTSAPADMHTGFVVSSGPAGSVGHTVEGNRGDQVGRFTFTVGEDVVLGCIDLPRLLLGRPRVTVTPPKPTPQPRPAHHPAHTGPKPATHPQPSKGRTMKHAKRNSKALGALLGSIGAWLGVALADGHVTTHEWQALAAVLVPAVVTYFAPKNATKR